VQVVRLHTSIIFSLSGLNSSGIRKALSANGNPLSRQGVSLSRPRKTCSVRKKNIKECQKETCDFTNLVPGRMELGGMDFSIEMIGDDAD
jgi:hypothetical protein